MAMPTEPFWSVGSTTFRHCPTDTWYSLLFFWKKEKRTFYLKTNIPAACRKDVEPLGLVKAHVYKQEPHPKGPLLRSSWPMALHESRWVWRASFWHIEAKEVVQNQLMLFIINPDLVIKTNKRDFKKNDTCCFRYWMRAWIILHNVLFVVFPAGTLVRALPQLFETMNWEMREAKRCLSHWGLLI